MSIINLTPKQIETIRKAKEWYLLDSYYKPTFVISGVAGSGKSTVIKYLIKTLELENDEVLYATYVAKAALRLRMAGHNANTIHSTFYKIYQSETGDVIFYKRKKIEHNIKCIVIDEAAMVPDYMIYDIISFRIPVILLGDNCQLPPLMQKNTFMDDNNLDIFLSESKRFNNSSGILTLATMARNKQTIPYGIYKKSSVVHYRSIANELNKYDVIICYKNSTRFDLNNQVRRLLGYYQKSRYPLKGEKIVCLKNNYNYELFYDNIGVYIINGLVGIMLEDSRIDTKTGKLICKFVPEFMYNDKNNEKYFEVLCHKEYFDILYDPSTELPLPIEFGRKNKDNSLNSKEKELEDNLTCFLAPGYALTCHKMQGSEADNVLVIADDHPMNHRDYHKYLYTAITRAKKSVTIATMK